jgi:hypothetical protein
VYSDLTTLTSEPYCTSGPDYTATTNTAATGGRLYRCDIGHAPWMLARADAEIGTNTLALPFRLDLTRTSPLLHDTERTDARICRLIATECRPPRKPDRRFAAP